MNKISKDKQKNSPAPVTTRQCYFVKNVIQNQPIIIANTQTQSSKNTMNKESNTKKHKHIKGVNENLSSSCGILTRRSYGSVGFNHQCKVQFNNHCSMNDHIIASDAILINQEKKQKNLMQQQKKHKTTEQQFRKQAVNFREYYNHFKMEEISDAYYCANQQALKAKQRQTKRQNVIKRVKSLSRSKSKEVGIEFRKKEQQQIQSVCLQLSQIKQVEQLKQRYSHVVVPQLMGTLSSFRNTRNTFNTQINTQQTFNSPIKLTKITPQNNQKTSRFSQNSPIQTIKTIGSRKLIQNASISNSKILEQPKMSVTSRQNSYFQLNNNPHSNNSLNTQNLMKESVSTNTSSLLKVLQKSKSTEDFIQKQRVKVVKEAFILNWKQGDDKKPKKHESIYQCKYTQNLKNQRQMIKEEREKQLTKLKYGENALKKNPLQKSQNQFQGKKYVTGYDSLKQYQMKFNQIAKNKIKSCIVAKN